MPASSQSIHDRWNVSDTTEDKGLILEIQIVAYDNGQVYIDNRPMQGSSADESSNWTGSAALLMQYLDELRKEARKRQRRINRRKAA